MGCFEQLLETVQYFCERSPLTLSKTTNISVLFFSFFIVPSFPHTLPAYLSARLVFFSVSTSETELRPQLHALLHFFWRHDLTQVQLCFAVWTQGCVSVMRLCIDLKVLQWAGFSSSFDVVAGLSTVTPYLGMPFPDILQ